jgi:hypothetical protein
VCIAVRSYVTIPLPSLVRGKFYQLPSYNRVRPKSSSGCRTPAPAGRDTPKEGLGPIKDRADFRRKNTDSRRFPLTSRPISYIMSTRKTVSFRLVLPQSGWLFPPSAYCPHDCECCPLPCKLSRYHLGPHTCGKRHSRFSTVAKLSFYLLACWRLLSFAWGRVAPRFPLRFRPSFKFQSVQGAKYVQP